MIKSSLKFILDGKNRRHFQDKYIGGIKVGLPMLCHPSGCPHYVCFHSNSFLEPFRNSRVFLSTKVQCHCRKSTSCDTARQSCGVAHIIVGLPYETKKFVVIDRCTADVRMMRNRLSACKCCFTSIVRSFGCAIFRKRQAVRQIADKITLDFH